MRVGLRMRLGEAVEAERAAIIETRRALLAARDAGCELKDLAVDMGLPLQTVASRVTRARELG